MRVTGPVTGGSHGWAFGGPVADLAVVGYRQDEFFLEGLATRYGPSSGSELAWDGCWQVEPAARGRTRRGSLWSGPRTRHRSTAPWWCCGTTSPPGTRTSEVGTAPKSTQVGTPSLRSRPSARACTGLPSTTGPPCLAPERYGSLSIPSDDYSFDIFTQAEARWDPTVRMTASTRWSASRRAVSSPRERHSPQPVWRRISTPSSRRAAASMPSSSPCTSVAEHRSRSATPS